MTATIAPAQSGPEGSAVPDEHGSDTPTGPVLRFTGRYLLATLLTFAALVFGVAARLRMSSAPAGDEPHYLAITVSLLKYHTVDPSQVYAHPADYHRFYPGILEQQVSTLPDGTVVPLHNAGGPLLWAPFYALGHRNGVAAFLVLVSVLIVFNLYRMLRDLRITPAYAGITTALFTLGSTIYVYAPMMFVESIGTLIVLYAARQVMAPSRSPVRLVVASAGLGYLPFVHGRFVLFTMLLGGLLAVRVFGEVRWRAWRPYAYALGPLVAIGGAVALFNALRYGTINPAPGNANMGAGLFQIPFYKGLASLLFDRYYGLFPYFPIFALVLPGIALSLRRGLAWVHVTILGITLPYLFAVSTFSMWWGGYSPPARFLATVAPLLAYYVAVTLQRMHAWLTTMLAMMLAMVAYMISLAGDLLPNERFDSGAHGRVMLIDRVGHLVGLSHVSRYLPSLLFGGQNWLKFGFWAAVVLALGAVVYVFGRRRDPARIPVPALPRLAAIPWVGRWL